MVSIFSTELFSVWRCQVAVACKGGSRSQGCHGYLLAVPEVRRPNIPQLVKSLLYYIPEAWKRYPFWAEPPWIGHYREYPLGILVYLKINKLNHFWVWEVNKQFLSFQILKPRPYARIWYSLSWQTSFRKYVCVCRLGLIPSWMKWVIQHTFFIQFQNKG